MAGKKQPSSLSTIAQLGGLRVLAHLLIALLHAFQAASIWDDQTSDRASSFRSTALHKLSGVGFGAVDLFMVISGLLTVRSLLHHQKERGTVPSLPLGALKRWLRFVPGVMAAFALVYMTRVGTWNPMEPFWIATGVFPWMQDAMFHQSTLSLGHLWSFATDFQATILLLLVATVVQNSGSRNTFQRRFVVALVFLIVVSTAMRAAMWAEPNRTLRFMASLPPIPSLRPKLALEERFNISIPLSGVTHELSRRTIEWFSLSYTNVFIRMSSFAGGGLIASALHSAASVKKPLRMSSSFSALSLVVFGACLMVVLLPLLPPGVDAVANVKTMSAQEDFVAVVLMGTLTSLAWVGLCAGVVLPPSHVLHMPWLQRVAAPVLQVMGKWTYLSYALHFGIMYYLACGVFGPAPPASSLVAYALKLWASTLAVSFALSAVLHYVVEKPYHIVTGKLIRRLA